MSDQSAVLSTEANAPTTAKPKAKRNQSFTVESIAVARLRARGIKSNDRLADEKKVVRGMLRRSKNWEALTKAAPTQYGRKGKVKTEANDRRPWGVIPASVAKDIIKAR